MKLKIAPSILAADKSRINSEIKDIEPYSDYLHIDVMDAKFVLPKMFPANELKGIKTKLPLDAHLMVEHPIRENYIDDFSNFASIITIHEECKDNIDEAIKRIKEKGIKVGLSIKPKTPIEKIKPYLDRIDLVLIMSVEPGYSGQKFIPDVLSKVKELRKLKPKLDIEIDGGINKETAKEAVKSGVNILVSASFIFGSKDKKKAIEELRQANG